MKNFYKKDGISRVYAEGGNKRFMQWFNSETHELENVPEVALCDEFFLMMNLILHIKLMN